MMRILVLALLLLLVPRQTLSAEPSPESHILIVWADTGTAPAIDAVTLGRFLGTLREADRLAIFLPSSRRLVLQFDTDTGKDPQALARGILTAIEGFRRPEVPWTTAAGVDAVKTAASWFRETNIDTIKVLVLIQGASRKEVSSPVGDPQEGGPGEPDMLLALNNILFFPILPADGEDAVLSDMAEQSGGRVIRLCNGSTLVDGLLQMYEAVRVRAVDLGSVEPLYESDAVCASDEATAAFLRTSLQRSGLQLSLTVLALLIGVTLCILTVLVWRILKKKEMPVPVLPSAPKEQREKPAFSKISMGVSRIRNSFQEAEARLGTLASDIEDFGSENWEIQRTMATAYVRIADELISLLDYLEPGQPEAEGQESFFVDRLNRILEDSRIERITVETGDRFHSKYHRVVGERESSLPSGTVLEVTRPGYIRATGFNGSEPFIIRPAEVIVSMSTDRERSAS